MPSPKKLIIGNWKMNPQTKDEAKRIIKEIKTISKKISKSKIVVCPPFVFLNEAIGKGKDLPYEVGAQNAYIGESGSHTGEVSAVMLKSLGLDYVIIGHSERRKSGETDEIVSQKVKSALEAGLKVVLCIGEDSRDENGNFLHKIKEQLKASVSLVERKYVSKLIIAYEPVWAIGAKEAMSPSLIHETMIFVKKNLADLFGGEETESTPVLYGGSVNFRNAHEIIYKGHVDGLLVGRESVNVPGFKDMLFAIENEKINENS